MPTNLNVNHRHEMFTTIQIKKTTINLSSYIVLLKKTLLSIAVLKFWWKILYVNSLSISSYQTVQRSLSELSNSVRRSQLLEVWYLGRHMRQSLMNFKQLRHWCLTCLHQNIKLKVLKICILGIEMCKSFTIHTLVCKHIRRNILWERDNISH